MRKLIALAVLAAVALPAAAAADTWIIDPVHSQITFKVRHFFTKVPGEFQDFSGTIEFDPNQPEKASVNAVIQTASIDTDNDRRDDHLRSDDFFGAETHPTITFVSTKVEKGEENRLQVHGDFTMNGITRPVVLDTEFLGAMDLGEQKVAGFSATTTVNRLDHEVKWNRVLDNGVGLLGDEVEIQIDIEAKTPKPEEAAKTESGK